MHGDEDSEMDNTGLRGLQGFINRFIYSLLLILGFVGCVSQFRGYWNLIDVYFISGIQQPLHNFQVINHNIIFYLSCILSLFNLLGNSHIRRSICQFYGMLLLFLLYCGTSLHGGVFLEKKRYTTGILFPNFFLTYMLATKVESRKSFVLNVVASPDDVISDATIDKATNM